MSCLHRAGRRWRTLILLLAPAAPLLGQAVPAYTPGVSGAPGFQLPTVSGTLRYSVSASTSLNFGLYDQGNVSQSANISGNLAYLSTSTVHPFSLIYSGGYQTAAYGQPNSLFQNLSLSQVFVLRPWSFVVSDTVSYLPTAPISGLSGVPGLGDVGLEPTTSGLLSNYGRRVNNTVAASASRPITNRTSVFASGSMGILRFPGNDGAGLENDQDSGSAGVQHNLSARTSIVGSYGFVRFTYPGEPLAYDSHTGTIGVNRQLTQRLQVNASVGPQYSVSSGVPSTLSYAYTAGLNYQVPKGNLSVNATRGTSSGQGVESTSTNSSVGGSFSRTLGHFSSVGVSVSYNRATPLPNLLQIPQYPTNSVVFGGQWTRAFTRTLSGYVSYTYDRQTGENIYETFNGLNGAAQTLGFGITYSPARPITLGH